MFHGQKLRTVCEVREVVKETKMCFSRIQIRSLHEVRVVRWTKASIVKRKLFTFSKEKEKPEVVTSRLTLPTLK